MIDSNYVAEIELAREKFKNEYRTNANRENPNNLIGSRSNIGGNPAGSISSAPRGRAAKENDNIPYKVYRYNGARSAPETGRNTESSQRDELATVEEQRIVHELCDLLGVKRKYPNDGTRSSNKKADAPRFSPQRVRWTSRRTIHISAVQNGHSRIFL